MNRKGKGILFVISAPAGAGKTTLVEMLEREFEDLKRSITYTTRKRRGLERDKIDYHFITREEFEKKIAAKEFLEHAKIYDEYYGTSKKDVESDLRKGKKVVLVIDVQGAMQIKKGKIPAVFIFIKPPSLKVLKERLEKRSTENVEQIERRLSVASHEMAFANQYDYQIENDDIDLAYDLLRSIIIAEEKK